MVNYRKQDMGRHTLNGNPPIEITLRRSARARRLSLRVSRLDGRVTLTMPNHAPECEGIDFLRSRESWLRGHLSEVAPVRMVRVGGMLPFEGHELPIVTGDGGRVRLADGYVFVPHGKPVGPTTKGLLRQKARDALVCASDHYAAEVNRRYERISLRDTRSRWGSCSSAGNLMYCWRLIMAPPDILRYVAAHEVAHLVEMNHSAAFWSVVEELFPDYERCRLWLRDNGDQLHRISFDD